MSAPREVTGRWEGIFNYPRDFPPNGFVATLIERAGAISGETEEVCDTDPGLGEPLHALIDGDRVGTTVRFVKRYDRSDRAPWPVRYEGTLSPEADEIAGEWTIPGIWSGTFIMVRQGGSGEAVAVEETVSAPVE